MFRTSGGKTSTFRLFKDGTSTWIWKVMTGHSPRDTEEYHKNFQSG